jgi:hypothetical protein
LSKWYHSQAYFRTKKSRRYAATLDRGSGITYFERNGKTLSMAYNLIERVMRRLPVSISQWDMAAGRK